MNVSRRFLPACANAFALVVLLFTASCSVGAADEPFHHSMNQAVERTGAFFVLFDVSDWIALGSFLAACIAAWHAMHSRRISDRMYSLAVVEQQRSEPAMDVYLLDSHVRRIEDSGRRLYVFSLVVTNKSLAANSIKELTLLLMSQHDDQPPPNIVCPHDANSGRAIGLDPDEVFRIPRPIAGGEAVSGIAVFPVADALLDHSRAQSYTVTAIDAHGHETQRQAILLKQTQT